MANTEHLFILKKGAITWNKWRDHNPDLRPDLARANLHSVNLPEVNLKNANLSEADLSNANLEKADLRQANLHRADLANANLTGALLSRTDLGGAYMKGTSLREADLSLTAMNYANLIGANLTNASLKRANLDRTRLAGANLSGALLWGTVFADTDLESAKNLDECCHLGPSTLGSDTLMKNKNLPLSFLRGCGIADVFIKYLPSLLQTPLQFYSCFISHSSKDESFARRLYADLQDHGVRCWFAPQDMKVGDRIVDAIDQSIRVYDKILLLLSSHSLESPWVTKEVSIALEEEAKSKKNVLFPIDIDNSVMESNSEWISKIRHQRHIANFKNWKDHDSYKAAFDRLLKDLKASENNAV